ncbi:hypothetical protein ACVIWU_006493 [Bradyrhizobium sp. USDA 4509]
MDEAREAIEVELAADDIEQDVVACHGYAIARRLDDAPLAPDAYAGVTRSLAFGPDLSRQSQCEGGVHPVAA